MKKFEIGNTYTVHGATYKITSRTPKFVTVEKIQHYGRYNEKTDEIRKAKIQNWESGEVVYYGSETIEA